MRDYHCSEAFRVNAHKRKLDVWLLYRCSHCDRTWKATVMERVNVDTLPHEEYLLYEQNDRDAAWRWSFDHKMLTRNKVVANKMVDYEVDGRAEIAELLERHERIVVRITSEYALEVRLDKILCEHLGVPRKAIARLIDTGAIEIQPAEMSSLKRDLAENVEITLASAAVAAAQEDVTE